MKVKIVILIILTICVLGIAGCKQSCKEPYKLINEMCCTDENDNQVCDVDELPSEEQIEDMDETSALQEADDTLYGEADPLDMPEYKMPEPQYDSQYETPELKPTPQPEIQVEPEVASEPEIQVNYNVKQTTVPSEGLPEAKPDIKEPKFEWEVFNLRYGYGELNRFDIRIKNLEDQKLEPRVQIYAIQDEEYRRIQVVYLDPLWPGQERLFDNMFIGKELDALDQDVKFEVVYHTPATGLVTDGAQLLPVLKRDIR